MGSFPVVHGFILVAAAAAFIAVIGLGGLEFVVNAFVCHVEHVARYVASYPDVGVLF